MSVFVVQNGYHGWILAVFTTLEDAETFVAGDEHLRIREFSVAVGVAV